MCMQLEEEEEWNEAVVIIKHWKHVQTIPCLCYGA